jgi:hypothetical protein
MKGLNYIEDQEWGVVGTVEYEVETATWHGELILIKDQPVSALVTYEAKNAQGLRKAFEKAIWEYKRITEETKKMIEDKYIEYTTKMGSLVEISFKAELLSGSGAEAYYDLVYKDLDVIGSSVLGAFRDDEVVKVYLIAKNEGYEALQEYIKQRPKKYKVDIARTYHCTYLAEYEVEAHSEEEALAKADDLVSAEFTANYVQGIFNDIGLVDDGDTAELI